MESRKNIAFTLEWWLNCKTVSETIYHDNINTAYHLHGIAKKPKHDVLANDYFDFACRYGDLAEWIGKRIIKKYGE